MRCSSFERLLDAYVDGDLPPIDRARVTRHVAACETCAGLLEEMRVIDALLLTPRRLEPAPNFTFKLMAEVRGLPRPHTHRTSTLATLGAYIVFAWALIGAFLVFGGAAARATYQTLAAAVADAGSAFATVAGTTGHLFGRHAFDVTAAMGGILAADLVAAAGIVGFYALLRSRRTTAAARVESC